MAEGRAADRSSVAGYAGDHSRESASSSESVSSMASARASDRRSVAGYAADSGSYSTSVADAYAEYARSRLQASLPAGGSFRSNVAASFRQAEIASMNALAAYRAEEAAKEPPGVYSPTKPGWHDYVTSNMVCGACSVEEIADQLARYAVPGQDPAVPVVDGAIYSVHDPFVGIYAGEVLTHVTENGLSITNRTLPEHLFYDGKITRTAWQAADGSWHVTTHGIGNNVVPGMSEINQWTGPDIFDALDRQMRENIGRHHGSARASW
ncbi:hypothetical protein [Mesorhizobium sp.]|uniref:hypothetical protein n=1 Tax=Mesorhizobium sp. TaxID=1871066 RepID=UPI000FE50FDB|nr:hypothetical protein [Mesorhizobium sp.]RWL94337.1 MAG: hypothetical protein EOR71_33955 [Mesorhizobium sp.]